MWKATVFAPSTDFPKQPKPARKRFLSLFLFLSAGRLAHFPLMAAICRTYLEDAEAVNREPDPELPAPQE